MPLLRACTSSAPVLRRYFSQYCHHGCDFQKEEKRRNTVQPTSDVPVVDVIADELTLHSHCLSVELRRRSVRTYQFNLHATQYNPAGSSQSVVGHPTWSLALSMYSKDTLMAEQAR
ncbi:hypothetical protein GALMADRAFT_238481 [Galerina marginata CBS 339.88]|uniref:Uncharacterized protein n=1 Tax=Galerina marginata (strain CBS 339.88) TaxID=685588 RepID=A0A067TSJ0_GALM3|nr:hypothetical protein GALMADRAFT_238481 [Galerina marginata CBS 339.88]